MIASDPLIRKSERNKIRLHIPRNHTYEFIEMFESLQLFTRKLFEKLNWKLRQAHSTKRSYRGQLSRDSFTASLRICN